MNRYYIVKAGVIVAAICVAMVGSSIGPHTARLRLSPSPLSAVDTVQAGIYHTGARLGHIALALFHFAR